MSRSLAEHKDVPEKLADLARIESLQLVRACHLRQGNSPVR
ncbi:hypothetical protein [Nitrosomonas supralitoralis]